MSPPVRDRARCALPRVLAGILCCLALSLLPAASAAAASNATAAAPAPHAPLLFSVEPSSDDTSLVAPVTSGFPPGHKPTRFAYAMMHYEGTPKDDEYLLGLRVLIRSIQDTNTPHDIVIITSTNVRESTKAALRSDGAILNEVANLQNPFETKVEGRNSYKSRFVYSLNKLYIWNMTQYERIAYLDSDNIFLSNTDDVFMCGHFCIVYMNPLIFHTGLMVVKPDTNMFNKLLHALYADESFSHDGADQGFLVSQFDVEHAPLFLPSVHGVAGKPSEEPAMRLNIGWNLNHFWYYIAFNWDWFFHPGAGADKEYPWIRPAVERPTQNMAPATSIAYCSGMMLKPWYWFPTMYFDEHYRWHAARDKMGFSYWDTLITRMLAFVPVALLLRFMSDRARIDRMTFLEPLRNGARTAFSYAPVQLGYAVGTAAFFFSGYVAFQLIPYVTPPRMAWFIFVLWHFGLMYTLLSGLVNVLLRPTTSSLKRSVLLQESKSGMPGEKEEAEQVAKTVTGRQALVLLAVGQALFFVNWFPLYPHFIVKIAVFEYLLLSWIGLQAHVFRRAAERMCALGKVGVMQA